MPEEQGVLNHQPGMEIGHVGKLEWGTDIAHRIDGTVAGPEPVVDRDSFRVKPYPGLVEPQPFNVRHPAGGHQNAIGLERP